MEQNMTLILSSGNHSLNSEMVITNKQAFMMCSESTGITFIVCKNLARISFIGVTKVIIQGLKFVGCGENAMKFVRKLIIIKCTFIGTMVSGTPLVLSKTETQIEDSKFLSNTVGRDYYYNNTNAKSGDTEAIHAIVSGAIFITHSSVTLERCIFDGNRAEHGAALFIESKGNLTFNNCRFLNSKGTVIDTNDGSYITDYFSIYENNTANLGAVFYIMNSSISFFGSIFRNNKANEKGGVIFMYKSSVNFDRCEAVGNSAKTSAVVHELLGSLTITDSNITQNTAADIGILNVEGHTVIINGSTFSYNQAHIGMIFISKVEFFTIRNTIIIHNNVTVKGVLYARESDIKGSGTLTIEDNDADLGTVYLVRCEATFRHTANFVNNSASFTVINSNTTFYEGTTFLNNGISAKSSMEFAEGGAITSIQSTISFYGHTRIEDNSSSSSGGGIYAIDSIVQLLNHACIKHNKAKNSGGGIYLYSSVLICEQFCLISTNEVLSLNEQAGSGGGIHAIGSSILVSKPSTYKIDGDNFDKKLGLVGIIYSQEWSNLIIERNSATQGGGFNFEANSKIYIQLRDDGYHNNGISFQDNKAILGGAIFINDNTTASVCNSDSFTTISVRTECFLQKFHYVDEGYCSDNETSTVRKFNGRSAFPIKFAGNFAHKTGSVLFGGLLDRCTVSPMYYKEYVEEGKTINHISGLECFNNLTSIDYQGNTTISSQAVRICFCKAETSKHDCSYRPQPYHVMKGETFNVTLVAVDHVDHPIETNIRSFVSKDGDLGERQAIMNSSGECQNFTFTVRSSRPRDEELTIYAEGPCYSLGMSKSIVNVTFKKCACPVGFEPKDDNITARECICVCAKELESYVTCDYPNRTIRRKPGYNVWIGTCGENLTTSLSSQYCYVTHPNCPFDYCTSPQSNSTINLSSSDGLNRQCAFHRSGLLCGSCKKGWSLSIGSSRCIKCPKSWPGLVVATIVYVLLFGLIMVIVIVH